MTLPGPAEWPTDRPLADLRDGRLSDLLAERAESTPERTALVDATDGRTWSYRDLDRRVDRFAADLRSVLDFDGGRIGMALGTRPGFAVAYFAAVRVGGSVVPLNVRLDAATLRDQADRADIGALLCGETTESLAREIVPESVPVGSIDAPATDDVLTVTERSDGEIKSATRGSDAERLVMFTSGTTGTPKGVRLTAENLVASAVGSAERLGVDPDDRWLVPLQAYHMGGLAPIVRSTLYGTTVVLQSEFDADATAAATAEFDATGVSLVPTALTRLLDAGWDPPAALRFVLLGGAPASSDLIDRCERSDVPVFPTYGLTETASQVATAAPAEAFANDGTVGRPIATADVTVVAADGESECDPGETGELAVGGPIVTPGYLSEARTAEAFGRRGLLTGDLGYADDAGRLRIVGRADDRIVTGGENVDPERVADAIRGIDGVADAAVVGLPDEEWGQRVAALVVPAGRDAPGTATDEASSAGGIRSAVRDSLADFEVPKTVGFADRLPRTPSGTVDRDAVRELLADDSDSSA